MMATLTDLLATLSNMLLVPDILFLLGFLALIVLHAGGVVAEAISRRRHRPAFARRLDELKVSTAARPRPGDLTAGFGLPARALREFDRCPGAREKTLDDLQLDAERRLTPLALGIRLGPMLGLAGTLIPLGPALVALSQGDMTTLSARLVVAFTTTVLGLVVGGAAYAMHVVRRRWYMQDLNDVEFLASRMVFENE